MGSLNTARKVLVAGAVLASLVAAIYRLWVVVAVLGLAIAFHAALWVYLPRLYPDEHRTDEREH